ncbi:MAG TPA: GGDEF domain-containing protein [Candidatus Avacidaminococcus intestinavium]|uniref:GGDEF domain-containing protein n=1 Tax=Candidatus Avacidaminococcus intestinavium TaxID=2840684 RepID=A0A9D1MNF3_9FIRM|nr:GGDEF domain-containing protein [Candidatus Avacidaminococcus intestinavium]
MSIDTKDEGIAEILKAVDVLENIYGVVRIIDPVKNKVISIKKSSATTIDPIEPCYGFWEKEQFCDNCVSFRAIKENDTFVKFEVVNGRIYMVTASPIVSGTNTYAVEMLNDITDKSILEGLTGSAEADFTGFVKNFNDLLIRDELTKLFNRRYINEKLPVEIFQSSLSKENSSLLILDIDEFKKINDQYGHLVGDQVLRQFSHLVLGFLIDNKSWLARYGGEEFLIYLHGMDKNAALGIAEQIRQEIAEHSFEVDGFDERLIIQVFCSIGVCALEPGMDMTAWIACADKNLYLAKERGGNIVY